MKATGRVRLAGWRGALWLGALWLGVPACGDDGGDESAQISCPTAHVTSVQTENLGATGTCAPAPVTPDVQLSTNAAVVTVQYHAMLMVCGGTIAVDLARSGNTLTLSEDVTASGECGCFNEVVLTVAIDLCAPGAYSLVIGGTAHDVTI